MHTPKIEIIIAAVCATLLSAIAAPIVAYGLIVLLIISVPPYLVIGLLRSFKTNSNNPSDTKIVKTNEVSRVDIVSKPDPRDRLYKLWLIILGVITVVVAIIPQLFSGSLEVSNMIFSLMFFVPPIFVSLGLIPTLLRSKFDRFGGGQYHSISLGVHIMLVAVISGIIYIFSRRPGDSMALILLIFLPLPSILTYLLSLSVSRLIYYYRHKS